MATPSITFGIVIPTYNRKALLSRAIDSLLDQTYTQWQICIVDDASSDQSKEHVEQHYTDERIHYLQQSENLGVNAARNRALDHLLNTIKCDYITFLDDDDYFDSQTLKEALKQIKNNPKEQWFVSARRAENGMNITRMDRFGTLSYINYFLGTEMDHDATHVIKGDLIGETRFSHTFKQAQEWIFFIQLARKAKMYLYDFPSTICSYLEDGLTAKVSKDSTEDEEAKAVVKLQKAMLQELGISSQRMECLKLQHRVQKTLKSKKYLKLLRYLPRYIYYKSILRFNKML